jgi:hypothetical protein
VRVLHWQRLATSQNRVLRAPGATPAAKRTQGACRPRDGASKWKRSRSRRRFLGGRQYRSPCYGQGRAVRRGRRAGHVGRGPPGTWEVSISPPEHCGISDAARSRVRARRPWRPCASGANEEAQGGTAERRQRSEAGRREVGASAQYRGSGGTHARGPRGGKAEVGLRNFRRERCHGHRAVRPSQRNKGR